MLLTTRSRLYLAPRSREATTARPWMSRISEADNRLCSGRRFKWKTLHRQISTLHGDNNSASSTTSSSASSSASSSLSNSNKMEGPRWLPKRWHPYYYLARMDKPIGSWLLFYPGAWSILMAHHHYAVSASAVETGKLLALFGLGSVIMRSAGCAINDLWDRDVDRQVVRTQTRPLASGALTTRQAMRFLALQLTAGLGILAQLNTYSILLGASSMALVVAYPLAKRFTRWPQAVLGLTFNWGALLGWSALAGSSLWSVTVPLYLAGIQWTLVYDTIYAHQDKKDDARIGVKSTALRFGDNTKPWLSAFSAGTIGCLLTAGYCNSQGVPFYASVLGSAAHLAWQIHTVDLDNRQDCFRKFVSNQRIGQLVTAGLVLDQLL